MRWRPREPALPAPLEVPLSHPAPSAAPPLPDRLAALLAERVAPASLDALALAVLDAPPPWAEGAPSVARALALVEAAEGRHGLAALIDAAGALDRSLAAPLRALGAPHDEVRAAPTPGAYLGPYRLVERVAEGALTDTYRAERGDAVVRLVLPRTDLGASRARWERWLVAARVADQRSAPGLPALERAGWEEGRPFAAWAWDDGVALADWIQGRAPLRLAAAWPLLEALLGAVGALHQRGLAHGALNAATVRVAGPPEEPRVTLHGVGDHLLGALAHPARLGLAAARALAPEQLRGDPPELPSDVFSLGTLLWDVLAGAPAFGGATALDAALARLVITPDPLSFTAPPGAIPDALDELALAALDRDPGARPADAGVLRHRLERALRSSAAIPSEYPDDDLDGAIATLLAAPDDVVALARLEATVERGAPVARVADALVMAAQQLTDPAAGGPARRRLLHHAAALLVQSGADPQRAEDTLALLVAADADDEEALSQLVRLLEARGASERALDLLVERAKHAGTPEERARALDQVARLFQERLGDPAQALVARVQAFCETPERGERVLAVEAAAGDSPAAWREVVAECAEVLNGKLPTERRVALLHRMGSWYEGRLGRPDRAYRAYQSALALAPAHDPSLARAEALLRASEHWRELVPVLLARARSTLDAAQARAHRAEAAQLAARRVGDAQQALALLGPLFEEDPSDHRTALLLAELRARSGDRDGAAAALTTALAATAGEARAGLACALGRLETERGQMEAAERHWRAALECQPGQLEALRALQEQHRRQGRSRELEEDLRAELEVTVVPSARCALLGRLARLRFEKLGDVDGAARALSELLALDPADATASAELGALLTREGRWAELAELLEQRALRAAGPAARAAVLAERAELLSARLGRVDEAMACWERVLEIEPGHPRALDAMARLHLQRGEDAEALVALDRLAAAEADPSRRAEHRLTAVTLLERQGRTSEAIALLERALEEAPTHRPALARLRQLELARGGAVRARALLEREIAVTPPGGERALVYLELARQLGAVPGGGAQAEGAAAFALENDPRLAAAHELLGDLALAAGRFGEAAGRFTRALELSGEAATGAVSLRVRLARSQLAAGDVGAAVATAEALAREHEGDRVASAAALDLLAEHGDPARAAALGRAHLDRFGGELGGEERAALCYALGRAAARLGDRATAVEWLERAVAAAPEGTAALAELGRLHEGNGAWSAALVTLGRQLERTPVGQRFELLLRLAEIEARHLGRTESATRRVLQALAERPADRRALVRLAEIHGESHRWDQVVALMVELGASAEGPALRAHYLEAAARVAAAELHDRARAAELAERALDADPTLDALAEEAVGWRRALHDRPGLVRSLERRVRALTARGEPRRALAALGELAGLYLAEGRRDAAVEALEAARRLEPQDPAWKRRLAELYAQEPARYLDLATALQAELVALDPFDPEPVRALGALHAAAGHADGAWCAAQVLVALAQARPDEKRLFRRAQPARPPRPLEGLSGADWSRHLIHPAADPLLGALLAALEPVWWARSGVELGSLGYPESTRVGADQHPGSMAAVVMRTAHLLGLPPPVLVYDALRPAPVTLLTSRPAAVALGARSLEPVPLRVSELQAAAQLIGLRRGLAARFWVPSAEALKAWVLAALRVAVPRLAVPAESREGVAEVELELARAPAELRAGVAREAAEVLRRGENVDVLGWLRGVDLSADRAGLLACDDLETALTLVRSAPVGVSTVARADRARELIAFASSADYLALRRTLRIGVGGARASLPPPPKPGEHGASTARG